MNLLNLNDTSHETTFFDTKKHIVEDDILNFTQIKIFELKVIFLNNTVF